MRRRRKSRLSVVEPFSLVYGIWPAGFGTKPAKKMVFNVYVGYARRKKKPSGQRSVLSSYAV